MAENLLEMSKWTKDLCLRKYFGPRGLSAPAPGLYNIFSETARPIKAKLFVEHPYEEGMKVDINGQGHMTKVAAMAINSKNV